MALKDSVSRIDRNVHLDEAFRSFSSDALKQLHEALSALANILEPVRNAPKNLERSTSTHLLQSVLVRGCLDAAKYGGLESILKIAALRFAESDREGPPERLMNLLEESCRSLASVSPLLLTETVVKAGYSSGAHGVLNALHGVLKELNGPVHKQDESECETVVEADERLRDLHEVVLQGLGSLAKSDPLKTRIIDRSLPYLVSSVRYGDSTGKSNVVSLALQALDFAEDEIAVQVAGNNPNLLADWFCLQRSLLIQAMARKEIRRIVVSTWESTLLSASNPAVTKLIRSSSDKTRSDDGSSDPIELFRNFADDESTAAERDRLVRQYNDIYGKESDAVSDDDSIPDFREGLLASEVYPLKSCSAEKDWVLQHSRVLETAMTERDGSAPALSGHVEALLDIYFPSRLLREQILPVSVLRPEASFNFRALMMPQRRYYSFQREGKLLSRICDKEKATLDGTDVHWTLGFTNSYYGGEFAEALVQLLYLCPMIRGLSFSKTGEFSLDGEEGSEGGTMLASLCGSLPAWISHLTFDGLFGEDELAMLVGILEMMGKLSVGQGATKATPTGNSQSNTQGKFSFLAIRRTSDVSAETWHQFFNLFGGSWNVPNAGPRRPLACLKSLDLSGNGLGDELCATLLHIVYGEEGSCCLQELDLSDNRIKRGSMFVRELKRVAEALRRKRNGKVHLDTLKLSSNHLNSGHAWVEILATVSREPFSLQILDLSANDINIDLTHYEQRELLIRSLLSSKDLVQLNLSCNRLSASTVDDVVRQLEEFHSPDCGVGFFLLENNEPALTPQQAHDLQSFSSSSRRVLLDRYFEKQEHALEDEEPVDVSEPLLEYDEVSVRSNDSHSVTVPSPTTDSRITVLFSAPLIFQSKEGQSFPFPKLNLEAERELIWQCLKEASRDIDLAYDNATSVRLLSSIAKKSTCLHYSGHGHADFLPFEDGTGGPEWFRVDKFRELIAMEGGAPFQLVFVSACYSGIAGRTFVEAGIPHVVCCRQESELNDHAALRFTRQFYLALAVGNTVKESFEQGKKSVGAATSLSNPECERDKFILLPEHGNHDVAIFNAKSVREWPRYLNQHSGRRGVHSAAIRNSELTVRNLIQEDPSPSPPQFFMGREIEMHKVLNELFNRRLVSVVGDPGIGRSSLICAVCHYINERKNIVSTWVERIYFVKVKASKKKKNRFAALAAQLLKRLVDEGKADPVDDDVEIDYVVEAICSGLKKEKALVVFDRVDLIEDAEEYNYFKTLLVRSLCKETGNVKILLTSTAELGIPSLGEHHIALNPLNLENTIRLFAQLCPSFHSVADRKRLLETLMPDQDEGVLLPNDPNLPGHVTRIFQALGRGIPSVVENVAYCIDKVRLLPRLLDGSIRNE